MTLSKGFSASSDKSTEVKARPERLPTLLVVDDERQITESLSDQFRHDYHVVTAGSADEALAILKQQDVSVIVSDQRMPDKTGSEMLAEAFLINPDAVRILLTGFSDIEAVTQAVNEGQIFFYLTKPWNNHEIETVIAKAVEHNFLLRDNRRLVEELRCINAELEERVKDRTHQLELRARELEEAEKALHFKNDELQRFTYSVTHDLRSPLVTVKTFLGYLERDLAGGDPEQVAQDLQFINGAADKMELMLNELLELDRIGQVTTAHVMVSLREILEEVLATLAGVISLRRADIRLPETDLALLGDRQRLCRIWQNLIENGIKYSLDDTPPLIELGVQQENGTTVFYVRDNGIGIDSRNCSRIFGVFQKLNPKSPGVGLGLSMVQRIVETYDGRVWVESAGEGQGSCFRFTLPGAEQSHVHRRQE